MNLSKQYYDELFHYAGQWDMPSTCGLKIINKNGVTYVITTELYKDNPGTSITETGESLAKQICASKGLNIHDIIYVECNPDMNSKLSFYDEEYFHVTFSEGQRPVYKQLTKEEVKNMLT